LPSWDELVVRRHGGVQAVGEVFESGWGLAPVNRVIVLILERVEVDVGPRG